MDAKEFGSLGGLKAASQMTGEARVDRARRAAVARWSGDAGALLRIEKAMGVIAAAIGKREHGIYIDKCFDTLWEFLIPKE